MNKTWLELADKINNIRIYSDTMTIHDKVVFAAMLRRFANDLTERGVKELERAGRPTSERGND